MLKLNYDKQGENKITSSFLFNRDQEAITTEVMIEICYDNGVHQ